MYKFIVDKVYYRTDKPEIVFKIVEKRTWRDGYGCDLVVEYLDEYHNPIDKGTLSVPAYESDGYREYVEEDSWGGFCDDLV